MAIIGISGKKQHGKNTVAGIIQYLTQKKDLVLSDYDEYLLFAENKKEFENMWFWKIKSFAEKLKQIVCILTGCTMEQLEDEEFRNSLLGEEWQCYLIPDNTPYPDLFSIDVDIQWIAAGRHYVQRRLTYRLLMQLLGTEAGRNIIHPNCWINALFADYRQDTGYKYPVMLGDVDLHGVTATVLGEPEKYNHGYPNWLVPDVRFHNEVKAIKDRGGIIIRVDRPSINSTDIHQSETELDNYKGFDGYFNNLEGVEYLIDQVKIFLQNKNII